MDIKATIKQKYNIDIDATNLLKLYKIDDTISEQELRVKFGETRKRWQQSANGAFEKVAERDRAHLQNADKYERILLDKKLFKALISYYKKGKTGGEATAFAKSFFQFIKDNNKTIEKNDVKFFFLYYKEQLKNQKAINEMLYNDFKVLGLKETGETDDQKAAKEKKTSHFAQNRFRKETLRILHACELKYAQVQSSEFLKSKEPKLQHSMYDFLRIDGSSLNGLKERIDKLLAEAFEQRQNNVRGSEYIPLTEFYNSVKDMLSQNDVNEDNFYHFKLLIRYPSFTPYMFLLETVNKNCVDKFVNEIGSKYEFAGEEEFLAVYLKPLIDGDHFACEPDRQLTARMRQIAQNPAELERARQKKAAELSRRRALPLPLRIVRFIATWPIYLIQFIFEIFNFSIRSIKRSSLAFYIPLFIPVLLFNTHTMFGMSFFDWIGNALGNMPADVTAILRSLSDKANITVFSQIIAYLIVICGRIISVAAWPAIVTAFLYNFACVIDQNIDLIGIHKTFMHIQNVIDTKVNAVYKEKKNQVYVSMIWPIIANILVVVLFALSIWLLCAITSGAAAPVAV